MTETEIKSIFTAAKREFMQREGGNIITGVNERNLCGRLSTYLEITLNERQINDYYSDTEYNRKQNGEIKTIIDDDLKVININCDIIVHSRGTILRQDNLIAIEMKKSTRPKEEKLSDKNRLKALTKGLGDDIYSNDGITHPEHVCGYALGVYIEINIEKRTCLFEYYKKGNKVFEWYENLPLSHEIAREQLIEAPSLLTYNKLRLISTPPYKVPVNRSKQVLKYLNKLFYTKKEEYANSKLEDPFLEAFAQDEF